MVRKKKKLDLQSKNLLQTIMTGSDQIPFLIPTEKDFDQRSFPIFLRGRRKGALNWNGC